MIFQTKNTVFWDIKLQFVPHRKHYVLYSINELGNWLMLCKILGFLGSDYEECSLLGCDTVWVLLEPTFRRNVSPPSSGWKESVS
jgi:hypothetical protein